MIDLTSQINILTEAVYDKRAEQSARGRDRIIVAIAGAPASGKSTLAAELARRLRLQNCTADVVPMDGFHLDNRVLDQRGMRGRKGAPETFDADGFVALVQRLRVPQDVAVPRFDRARDIAVAGAAVIPADSAVVIVEGNYLLFDEAPWNALAPIWDVSVRLDVPMPELRARLIQRWLSHNLSRMAAIRRAESNDIPNAQRVSDRALPADLEFQWNPSLTNEARMRSISLR